MMGRDRAAFSLAASAPAELPEGEYTVEVMLEGGSGRAEVASPALLTVEDGTAVLQLQWSSPYYDYMIVDGEKYTPVNEEGDSVFEIPAAVFNQPIEVIADTTAMSTPHEITYTLILSGDSVTSGEKREGNVIWFLALALALGVGAVAFRILWIRKKRKIRKGFFGACLCLSVLMLTACGSGAGAAGSGSVESPEESSQEQEDTGSIKREYIGSPELAYRGSMELDYAREFAVDYYEGGYGLVTTSDGTQYLVIPEGKEAPEELEEDIVLLRQPLQKIYLAASAVMDMFVSLDALEEVRFSALDGDSWYIPEAKAAMDSGEIRYAGKYSAPDYEQILAGGCGLAIENTMIYHTPEVKEQLESCGIPVLVDYSSYEEHPLGRTEWVKLYGLLTGREEEAGEAFQQEKSAFESAAAGEQTGKTVAFFYITSAGEVKIRRPSDYLPKMIEMAGGTYVFRQEEGDDSTSSTMTMEMEEFYSQAKDADYIIYNSTVDGELSEIGELTAKSSLLESFKAVREGNVYCTSKNLYQSTMELGTIISDIHGMLKGEEDLTYLYKLEDPEG